MVTMTATVKHTKITQTDKSTSQRPLVMGATKTIAASSVAVAAAAATAPPTITTEKQAVIIECCACV